MIGSLMVVTLSKSRILINSEKSVMCKIGSSPSSSNTSTNNRNSGLFVIMTYRCLYRQMLLWCSRRGGGATGCVMLCW